MHDIDVSPEYIIDAANDRLVKVGSTIDRLTAKNVAAQKDMVSGVASIDSLETGKVIRDGIMSAKTDASVKMSIRAEELGINDADITVQFQDWAKKLKAKFDPVSRFDDPKSVPEIYKQILKEIGPKGIEPASFADIKAIRERITDDIVKSLSPVNVDRKKVRFLVRLKKDVDGLMDSLDDTLGENYSKFRKEYFDNYVKPFESGAIFKSKSKDGTGFYKIPDEKVADLFLGSQSAARQFNTMFKNDPEMTGTLFSSMADKMGDAAIREGALNETLFKKFMKENSAVLNELPDIKKSFGDIETAQTTIWERQAQLGLRRDAINKSILGKKLEAYAAGTTTTKNVLQGSLSNPKQMKQLVSFIRKDPEALDQLRKVYWQKVSDRGSLEVLSFLEDNKTSLSQLYSDEHLRDMYDVSAMKTMMENVTVSAGKAYQPEPLKGFENLTGMKLPQAATRYWAFMSGRVPKYYLAFDIAKSALYRRAQREFDALLGAALYDPNIAKDVADSVRNVAFTTKKAKRLGGRLFALGIPYLQDTEGKQTIPLQAPVVKKFPPEKPKPIMLKPKISQQGETK